MTKAEKGGGGDEGGGRGEGGRRGGRGGKGEEKKGKEKKERKKEKKLPNCFPKCLLYFAFPLAMHERSNFSLSSPAFDIANIFFILVILISVTVPLYDFNLHFSNS